MTEALWPEGLEPEPWDPLHPPRVPGGTWSTSNLGEALPGVATPMGWTLWGDMTVQGTLFGFHAIGVLSKAETVIAEAAEDRVLLPFFGRGAINVEMLGAFADRLPGTSGPLLAEQMLGRCPDHITAHPTYRRYPIIAWRLPLTFATMGVRIRRARAATQQWYEQVMPTVDGLDLAGATGVFTRACDSFQHNISVQAISLFGAIQPLYEQISSLAKRAGMDPNGLMGGYGSHAETEIVVDLWAAGRGEISLDELVRRHGYHGPFEGEVSARVWREDHGALERIIADYAALPDGRDPRRLAVDLVARRERLERDLLAALPAARRPIARLVLAAARKYIPTRGGAKVAFLQSTDIARASARRLGEIYVGRGTFDDPEDIFYHTVAEVSAGLPADTRDIVGRRRARRARFQELEIPESWIGVPTPIVAADRGADDSSAVTGIGVSAGVIEGPVRVVHDPTFAEVEPEEILVAPTTDPSWAAVMYISRALVVDIGGALSHAAIVARELGIPCVVNTGDGSSRLSTGDWVRVDGTAGTVEILKKAQAIS